MIRRATQMKDGVLRCRSRAGSVLMEFVIVAPLYFVLLGGLFIVGDLAMNRIRVHIGDHFVTWVAGSGVTDDKKVKRWLKPMYDVSIGGNIDDAGFKVDRDTDKEGRRLNQFMALFMGHVKRLPLKMPDWARGMFGMEEAVFGSSSNDEYANVTFESEHFRSFSFHRLPHVKVDTEFNRDFNRKTVSAADLVQRGYLDNVYRDTWPYEPFADVARPELVSSQHGAVSRTLGYFGE